MGSVLAVLSYNLANDLWGDLEMTTALQVEKQWIFQNQKESRRLKDWDKTSRRDSTRIILGSHLEVQSMHYSSISSSAEEENSEPCQAPCKT